MASKSENSEIAVLQEQVRTMKDDVSEIKADVKDIITALDNNYVKKSEFQQFKIVAIPATVLITAVITALVGFYFANRTPAKTSTNTTSQSTTTTPATPTVPASSSSTSSSSNTTPTTPASNGSTPGASVNVPLPSLTK